MATLATARLQMTDTRHPQDGRLIFIHGHLLAGLCHGKASL
jgi:hypothetical protein